MGREMLALVRDAFIPAPPLRNFYGPHRAALLRCWNGLGTRLVS